MTTKCPGCGRLAPEGASFCPYDGGALPTRRGPVVRRVKKSGRAGAVLGGRYRIQGFVDKGATARVYLADDLETGHKVAVKLFAPSVALGEEMRQRFFHGAEAVKNLCHPNVIRVLDLGVAAHGPYLVLEPLHGEGLGARLRRDLKLSVDFAVRLIVEAARGLAAVHALGLVHRDVKPDNLFLVEDEQGEVHVKVIDFGMAKVVDSPASHASGLVMGTMEYMAPEQVLGDDVDARADVYSLGVVLFRALTGRLPFEAFEPQILLAQQVHAPMPRPSRLDGTLDPRIEKVVLAATRKVPENRYESARAFADDLLRATRPKELVTPPPMKVEPDRYLARNKLGADAQAVLAEMLRKFEKAGR